MTTDIICKGSKPSRYVVNGKYVHRHVCCLSAKGFYNNTCRRVSLSLPVYFYISEILQHFQDTIVLKLPNVTMRLLCTSVQPTNHQDLSTVTVHSTCLNKKVYKVPLYCIGGWSRVFKIQQNIYWWVLCCGFKCNFYDTLIVLFITSYIKIWRFTIIII